MAHLNNIHDAKLAISQAPNMVVVQHIIARWMQTYREKYNSIEPFPPTPLGRMAWASRANKHFRGEMLKDRISLVNSIPHRFVDTIIYNQIAYN